MKVTAKKNNYLVCPRRRNNPRIHLDVCRNTCRYNGTCQAYLDYRQPSLFDLGQEWDLRRTMKSDQEASDE